ncbi:MAG: hypothetical protein A2010_03540 [Nitrospirae bacterium GWD2_57_9]|nr:MAG: hypothetical protein A2010_03540 [Nitrospirae bacterium GWD2_57_9]OGW48870.1 MAG: hypothetical protein A2078_09205 [Nitrospirae bacterium GWC2_57_9]
MNALPDSLFRAPHAARRTANGFTYVSLLAAIVVIGITLGSAGKSWQAISAREKEKELLFRGNQYREAIIKYRNAIPGIQRYPPSIEELLKDSRTVTGKRYLRRKFKDPISGEDFVEIRDVATRGIIGMHSPSEKEPLQKKNFPDPYREFEGKTKYSEWLFQALPQQTLKPPG